MNFRKIALVACLLLPLPVVAGTIVLNDGSQIKGEVISMSNGQYKIKTGSMGVITLSQGQIRSISKGGAPAAGQSSVDPQTATTLQSIQSRIINDSGMMASIMALQNNPDMKAVLQDPEIMQAIQNLDLETLRNHPKMKKLMQNREVRDITSKAR